MVRESRSPAETEALGRELAQRLRPGEVVLLCGDVGSGKSVLARGIIHALPGGKGRAVRSPTFVYVHHHPTNPPVHHVDLYRLSMDSDPADLGLDEWADGESVMLVEWAQRLELGRFRKCTTVQIESLGGDKRRITIERK